MQINVVREKRLYRSYVEKSDGTNDSVVSLSEGVLRAKAVFNQLHDFMAKEGYEEVKRLSGGGF